MTFEEFWRRYYRDIVGELIRFGRLPEDAEELASDTLRAVWPDIQKVRREAWWVFLRTAAHRKAINQHRDAHAQRRDASRTGPLDEVREDSHHTTPEDLAIARERIARLRADIRTVMDELPEDTRLYIVLRHRNHGYEEIARKLRVTLSAVQSRLHRATKRFEERLGPAPEGITWIELAGELTDDHEN